MRALVLSVFTLVFMLPIAQAQGANCRCGCQPGDHQVYKFSALDPFTHEQFHCDIPSNALKVKFYNDAEMIKGFDHQGKLKIKDKKLRKYYFDAYHDWRRPFCKGTVCTNNPAVICSSGTDGRELIPGDYGAQS